jgi:hypothetical protein
MRPGKRAQYPENSIQFQADARGFHFLKRVQKGYSVCRASIQRVPESFPLGIKAAILGNHVTHFRPLKVKVTL